MKATINDFKCDHCGSIVQDFTGFNIDEPFWLRLIRIFKKESQQVKVPNKDLYIIACKGIIEREKDKNLLNSLNVLEGRLRRSGAEDDSLYVMRARLLLTAFWSVLEAYEDNNNSQSTLKVCKNCKDYCTARCPFFEHDFGENWFCGNFNKKEESN